VFLGVALFYYMKKGWANCGQDQQIGQLYELMQAIKNEDGEGEK
jgi:hypothetical protein